MVPCILYIVIYMKHTSNLERAIGFASQHLRPPLSLDLKKIFWDVEIGKFSTIKESLDHYLQFWENDALEFVEAFHLIESSLYEPSNSRRILTLEKALQVILDGVYDRMLNYTHSIKAPLTNLYMLGIVLPTLGLALLPLASALLGGLIKSIHVFVFFNLINHGAPGFNSSGAIIPNIRPRIMPANDKSPKIKYISSINIFNAFSIYIFC